MNTIFFGLGSNIGDREQYLRRACDKLADAGISITQKSSLYETEPVGLKDQDWFLNMVIAGATDKSPQDVLATIHMIEKSLDRERIVRWGPRTIDIDILLYGDAIMNLPDLHIPHARMLERKFVLMPLAEITPKLIFPTAPAKGKTVEQLLQECPDDAIVRLFESS